MLGLDITITDTGFMKINTFFLLFFLSTTLLISQKGRYYLEHFDGNPQLEFCKVKYHDLKGVPIKNASKTKAIGFVEAREEWLTTELIEDYFTRLMEGGSIRQYNYFTPSDSYQSFDKYDELFIEENEKDSSTFFLSIYLEEVNLSYQYTSSLGNFKTIEYDITYSITATDFLGDTILTSLQTITKQPFSTYIQEGINIATIIIDDLDNLLKKKQHTPISLPPLSLTTKGINATLTKNNSITLFKNQVVISGLVLNEMGYALTDYRFFIHHASKVKALLANGDTCSIELVRLNKLCNLALIKIINPTLTFTNIQEASSKVKPLDKVKFWGVPGSIIYANSYSEGYIAGRVVKNDLNYFLIDAMPHWGYTGAGILSKNNELIGLSLLLSFDQRLNLVMPCLSINDIYTNLALQK